MGEEKRPNNGRPTLTVQQAVLRHLPALVALVVIGTLYGLLSEQLAIGPRGLIPGLIIALAVLLLAAIRDGRRSLGRTIGLALLAVVTIAEILSTSALVAGLLTATQRIGDMPHTTALALLRDAAVVWVVNILTFSLWYWEIDAGGPHHRHHVGYHSEDFGFPQAGQETASGAAWVPHYVDYLFLAFNTSTAFSPTDTLVLSIRAKLLMMAQALISLTVLAIIAARAINML